MRRWITLALVLSALAVTIPGAVPGAGTSSPGGPTAIALDGSVQLAWQPVAGASAYTIYRGSSTSTISTLVSPAGGVTGSTFSDATAANGTTYFYGVRAIASGQESASSLAVQATPRARSCSNGNPTVLENCYPGTSPWDVRNTAAIGSGGIEGYATATSVNKGGSLDLKVNSDDNTLFNIEVYRTGYYGGAGARLFSVIHNVPGTRQPACVSSASTTGLLDCSNWTSSATLTTSSSWPSGAYVVRLVRLDTGADNQVLLVVRDDARSSDVLYGVGFATYQAYNNYGGKSLYDFNSSGNTTVAGTPRAVKVSYDRPFAQPVTGLRDWYTRNETGTVTWLEQEGYDVSYISDTDLESNLALPLGHKAYISPAHDEYVSSNMRTALKNARDARVGLFFAGSNEIYWKIRFESNSSGSANRIQVCYKSTQTGPPDPSGIQTGTWRDPAGANEPENALSGQMYVGDNDTTYFPLVVSATQGGDRVYRYTPLSTQTPGTSTSIGTGIIGWEWDARVANGSEPAGVITLAGSPTTGQLIQGNGAFSTPGSATATVTKYTAPSGALVFATGTNHWSRGLARNTAGVGEPEIQIQQITTNVLADMGAQPRTPATGIVLDGGGTSTPVPTGVTSTALGSDQVQIAWTAVPGADGYNVYRALTPRSGGQPLGTQVNPALVTGTSFVDSSLNSTTTYYYAVTAVVTGAQSNASSDAQVTTPAAAGQPTRIEVGGNSNYTSSTGAVWQSDSAVTGGQLHSITGAISNTNDPAIYRTERWGQFSYAIPLPNGTYDIRFHFAEIYFGVDAAGGAGKRVFGMDVLDTTASPDLANIDIYAQVGARSALVKTVTGVQITDGVLNIRSVYGSADDPTLEGVEIIPTAVPPTVTGTVPSNGATGMSRLTRPRVTFSRAMDASTITGSSFTLIKAGVPVAATVSYDATSQTATLVPAAALDYSTNYTARVNTTIKAADGIPLGSAVDWSFTVQNPQPPQVTGTVPADGATAVSPSVSPRATFSRSLDPATVTASSFVLTGPSGSAVPASVAYDDTTRTATLAPTAALAPSTVYTARLLTTIAAFDGVPLASPFVWTFTTAAAQTPTPTVTSTSPASGATGVALASTVAATFSIDMDASSFTSSAFTLNGPGGPIAAAVAYDGSSRTATLTTTAGLAYSTLYTATLATTVHSTAGAPLAAPFTWSFTTTAPPPPPTVTTVTPVGGAVAVARSSTVTARFSRAMGAATITSSSFTVTGSDGGVVPATVTYDASTFTATLTPTSALPSGAPMNARIDTTVKAADGTALATPVTWAFTTAACPCSLFTLAAAPNATNLPVRDGRSGLGPWSYELGVKIRVDQPMTLDAIRFFKQTAETGAHVGSVWTSAGSKVGSATFSNETASGWQQASLDAPLVLQAGTTYVVSVNANAYFGTTALGLQSPVVAGPLRSVADGANGVFGAAAGIFPTSSYNSSNYYVDVSATPVGDPIPPTVTSVTPAAGATGALPNVAAKATFSRPINPATLTGSTFALRDAAGTQVAASISYVDATNTAVVTPTSALAYAASYTVVLSTGVRATDGVPLAAPVAWSFTTVAQPSGLTITGSSPGAGAVGVTRDQVVQATFSRGVDTTTLDPTSFHLLAPGGAAVAAAITYDPATQTASLTPNGLLTSNTTYTAEVTAGVRGTIDNAPVTNPTSWSFTTGSCPCSLFTSVLVPTRTGNPVQDGRSGAGPWSRELGAKITVTSAATLQSIRFYKDPKETGSHTGTVWTTSGVTLATVTFASETASGWQQATLSSPLALQAGTTYVVSVNFNAYYDVTPAGLQAQITAGPLRSVADGANGVYSPAAGVFPTSSYNSGNYFVDVIAR